MILFYSFLLLSDKEHKCAIVGEEKKTRPGVYISSKVEDPFNCRKYFFCIQNHFTKNWTTQHFKCPEKKGFDPVKRECDWMDYMPDCHPGGVDLY